MYKTTAYERAYGRLLFFRVIFLLFLQEKLGKILDKKAH